MIRNAADDPLSSVRLKNMEYLVNHFPEDSDVRKMLFKWLEDEDMQICRYAFTALTPKSTAYLYSLVGANSSCNNSSSTRQLHAVKLLMENEKERCLDTVLAFYPRTRHIIVKQYILDSIVKTNNQRVQSFLISQLNEAVPDFILTNIIELIGKYGSHEAVEPLYSLSVNRDKNKQLRNMAGTAIKQIKARIGPGESGWLSISGRDLPDIGSIAGNNQLAINYLEQVPVCQPGETGTRGCQSQKRTAEKRPGHFLFQIR